jgi:hypothetical protein
MSMVRSEHHWARTLVRRGLVAATLVLALAMYGVVTAGTQSFAFKPTGSVTPGDGGRSVSMAVSPTNGSLNVATQGPNHSLYFFWNVNGTWNGPLGLGGAGATWSAPTIVAETGANNGNFDIAVQGPSNTLWFYWDISGTWHGPLQVGGPGTTFSTPGMAADSSSHLQVLAEGPANTLYAYWNVNAQFFGPLQIGSPGSTFSGPTVGDTGGACSVGFIAEVQDSNHNVEQYVRNDTTNTWSFTKDISTDSGTFSAPTLLPGTCRATFEGKNHALYDAVGGTGNPNVFVVVGGTGTTYSQPSQIPAPTSSSLGINNRDIAVQGPSNTLSFYHRDSVTPFHLLGPATIGAAFSGPSLVRDLNNNLDIVVQGPSNTLWAYWVISFVVHGPLQVGGPGTSFSSDN